MGAIPIPDPSDILANNLIPISMVSAGFSRSLTGPPDHDILFT